MDNKSLKKFFLNECAPDERKEVLAWLLSPKNDFAVRAWMLENWELINESDIKSSLNDSEIQNLWSKIESEIGTVPSQATVVSAGAKAKIGKYLKYAAAIILFVTGAYIAQKYRPSSPSVVTTTTKYKNEVNAPQSNISVLELEGGTKIFLDNVKNGLVASQNNVSILKDKYGQLTYVDNGVREMIYNTISVPKGSKSQKIVLSDGTTVWLNAGTSFVFPIAFVGNERRVTIQGEGYFEVAKNKSKPFYVVHNDLSVKVLGTHFNVDAYPDGGDVKVTLLEGLVNVSKGNQKSVLNPGQQALVNEKGMFDIQKGVDLEKTTAWKEEQFYFDGDDIVTVMRQVERFYNVKVVYKDAIKYSFVAKISRKESLSELLKVLELTNVVHFEMVGNTVIVSK